MNHPVIDYPHPAEVPRHPYRGEPGLVHFFNVYDKVLLCHSELNSKELEKYEKQGCIGVYYWSHALIARDWFRYAEYEKKFESSKDSKFSFLIYNRAWAGTREYRLKFVEMLIKSGLHSQCLTKFNPIDQGLQYRDHVFSNTELQISNYDFENYFPLNTFDATSSADFVIDDYVSTDIEVVLETLFDDTRIHLTEKTLRPIACGQPFILAATPGSLEYLRRYGFETFSSVIDESYDTEPDPVKRLERIIEVMKSIQNLNADKKAELHSIALRNRARFFSKDFHHQVVEEFCNNLARGLEEMKKYCRASFLKHYLSLQSSTQVGPTTLMKFESAKECTDLLAWVESQAADLIIDPSQLSSGANSM